MEINKFEDYSKGLDLANKFFESLGDDSISNDSEKYKKVQDSEIKKLKNAVKGDIHFNFGLIASFGAGIGAMYPIVDSLIALTGPKVDTRTVVLLTIAGVYMIIQGEVSEEKERKKITGETKVILSELQLAGYPNVSTGTKKGSDNSMLNSIVNALKSIYKIFKSVKKYIEDNGLKKILKRSFKNTSSGFADMFAYTLMMVPIMNSINVVIQYSKMDLNSFVSNTMVFIAGITTIIAKHGSAYFVNKMKNFFNLDDSEKSKIKKEIQDKYDIYRKKTDKPHINKFVDNDSDIIQEDKTIDYLLDKIRYYGKESLTKKELDILNDVSNGKDITSKERELIDKLTKRDGSLEYDPRKDDGMIFNFNNWSNNDINKGRLEIFWNEIDDDSIEHFFNYFKLDKSKYTDEDGDLPGDLPSDLVDKFNFFIKNIF